MKEVIAIIRNEKWQATREAIETLGVEEMLYCRVLGRGRQRGLRYLRRASDAGEGEMPYLPKRMVVCLVADEKSPEIVNGIIRVNQSGNFGDGKIFVRQLSAVVEADPSPASAAVTSSE